MKKEYLVRGTKDGAPFEFKGHGETINEAIEFVRTQLRQRSPKAHIDIAGVTEMKPIKETVGFNPEDKSNL